MGAGVKCGGGEDRERWRQTQAFCKHSDLMTPYPMEHLEIRLPARSRDFLVHQKTSGAQRFRAGPGGRATASPSLSAAGTCLTCKEPTSEGLNRASDPCWLLLFEAQVFRPP